MGVYLATKNGVDDGRESMTSPDVSYGKTLISRPPEGRSLNSKRARCLGIFQSVGRAENLDL